MKALSVAHNGILSVVELPKPSYNDCQALVKTVSCGVCNGTDMKLVHGSFKNMDKYPMLLGHEAVGRVVEIGCRVTSFAVGDLVLLPFLYDEVEGYSLGWGAYAEYGVVGDAAAYMSNGMGNGTKEFSESFFAQTVVKQSDKIDGVYAAMIITFREVLSAIKRFGFQPNQCAVIFGAGPVGLCFARFAKLLGLATVIVVDIDDDKVREAKHLGVDYAFNSTKIDVNAEIRNILPDGADYVVDAVGMNALVNQGMKLVKHNGKICGYGISPKLSMELDWSDAPYNWSLHFVQFPLKEEEAAAHSQVMAWINAGVLDPQSFVSHVIDFKDIMLAFELVEQRLSTTKKIIIKYTE